jgi:REP element-mobilizing transposase RayT
MAYDPHRHHRRSIRLQGYDYSQPAAYFVTICTHGRVGLFGEVVDGIMRPNALGLMVEEEWRRSETLRAEVVLDAYVVMPDHLHGVVVLVPPDADPVGGCDPSGYRLNLFSPTAGASGPTAGTSGSGADASGSGADAIVGPHGRAALQRPPRSLGAFVAGFKSAATKRINRVRGTLGAKVWQYKFYDRVLRDEHEWRAVRRYIEQNPARWEANQQNLSR